jgi:hypothetical protein
VAITQALKGHQQIGHAIVIDITRIPNLRPGAKLSGRPSDRPSGDVAEVVVGCRENPQPHLAFVGECQHKVVDPIPSEVSRQRNVVQSRQAKALGAFALSPASR